MSDDLGANDLGDQSAYRYVPGPLVFWDLTNKPTTNSDREAKLGSGITTHAMALLSNVTGDKLSDFADGLGVITVTSFRVFEPDNWMLRLYSGNGDSWDGVWSTRLIVGHEKHGQSREHRSTMWIDDCDEQNWAWSQDLFWIKKLGAECSHEELRINGAGFLSQLYGTASGGSITRAALMLNVAKNAGAFTDGAVAAAFWHLLAIFGGGTGTQECGDVFQGMGMLRGDVEFLFGSQPAHIALTGAGEEVDVPCSGAFMIGPPAPKPPADLAVDPKSNQPIISRSLHQGLRPWVKIPRPWVPTANGRALPATYTGLPAGTVTPTANTRGVFNTSLYAAGAVTVGSYLITEIPRKIPPGWGLTVEVNYVTIPGGFGRSPTARIEYCAIAPGGSIAPGAVTGTISKTFDATGSSVENVKLFHIPYADLVGAVGGKLAMAFYRGPDVGGDVLDVIEFAATFGPEYS